MPKPTTCRYCDHPAAADFPLCDFCTDWECACNLCEDELGGSIFGPWVVNWMVTHGWTHAQVKERRAECEAKWARRAVA